MNKITSPLKPQAKGPEVAHLHKALTFLGFTIGDAEQTNQHFGVSTRQAVSKFQMEHQLPITGGVDEATAIALNTVLAEKGALDPAPGGDDMPTPNPPPEDLPFSVQGEVVEPDGTPLPGHPVHAFDRALCEWRLLGGGRSNDLGRYVITYNPQQIEQWSKTRADLKVEVQEPETPDPETPAKVLAESAGQLGTDHDFLSRQRHWGFHGRRVVLRSLVGCLTKYRHAISLPAPLSKPKEGLCDE